jgi:ankyrin repeat protein
MEWLLNSEEKILWSMKVSHLQDDELLEELKTHLTNKKMHIGPGTFRSGLMLVLHEACRSNHIIFVKYLLDKHKKDFNINQLILYHPNFDYDISLKNIRWLCNHRKQSLLHAAVYSHSVQLLELLLLHKASVHTVDCCSLTPLFTAITLCDVNAVELLIKAGSNVNYCDDQGRTCLMYASLTYLETKDYELMVSLLLKAGADVKMTDKRGFTALHVAVINKNKNLLKILLKSFNVSPTINPRDGTPYAFNMAIMLEDLYLVSPAKTFPNNLLLENAECNVQMKIDDILLHSGYFYYQYCNENSTSRKAHLYDSMDLLEKAVSARGKLQCFPADTKPIEAYGKLKEIVSFNELEEKYAEFNQPSVQVKLAYQYCIIQERCLGYGDGVLIEYLLMFGHAFCYGVIKKHVKEGVNLWLRASEMILYRLKQNIYSNLKDLRKLIESGMEKCLDLVQNLQKEKEMEHITSLLPVLGNLIYCEHLAIAQFKSKHYHDIISPASYKYMIRILHKLFVHPIDGINVTTLIERTVDKCYKFYYGFELSTNLLDVALDDEKVPIDFLSQLVKKKGKELVNEIGLFGLRPLTKAKSVEVASFLLDSGAHFDAVNEDGTWGSDFVPPPPVLPLQCLVARRMVSLKMEYRSRNIPKHVTKFVGLHDPDYTQLKIKGAFKAIK